MTMQTTEQMAVLTPMTRVHIAHLLITRHGMTEPLTIRLLWRVSQPTVTDYTTWQAMFGNGVLTGIAQVITPAAQVLIQPGLQQVIIAFSGAATGTAMPTTAGLPSAPATTRASAAPTAAFVFAWTRGEFKVPRVNLRYQGGC